MLRVFLAFELDNLPPLKRQSVHYQNEVNEFNARLFDQFISTAQPYAVLGLIITFRPFSHTTVNSLCGGQG